MRKQYDHLLPDPFPGWSVIDAISACARLSLLRTDNLRFLPLRSVQNDCNKFHAAFFPTR